MTRLFPMEPPYEPEVAGLLERMTPGTAPIGLFRLFVRNLPMADAVNGWGGTPWAGS